MHPDGTFGVFDTPDGGRPCPRRATSTTPLQALALLHAPFVQEMARRFAERVREEARATADVSRLDEAAIVRAFALAFQREPAAEELAAASALAREHGLIACCRALLATAELSSLE
jgi:hypothetical protein